MKTKAEILEIFRKEKPELVRRYGLKRLALFGSYAREDQREDSDVDILVEIDPQIGLGFVELADRIEDALGIRTEVSRTGRSSHVIGRSSKRTWLMSRRGTPPQSKNRNISRKGAKTAKFGQVRRYFSLRSWRLGAINFPD